MPRLLIALMLAALVALPQQPPDIPSPYLIAEAFASSLTPDVPALMTRLGLPTRLHETSEFRDFDCGKWTCRAEVTGAGPVALTISNELFFRIIWMEQNPRSRTWSVRGYLDGGSKYGVSARFISDYLLVKRTGSSGFPSASMIQTLYEPLNGKLVSILRLPADGYDEHAPPEPPRGWNVAFALARPGSADQEELVVFARLVVTTRETDPPTHADERRVATFIRPKGAPTFRLDPKRSDITQRHLDELFRVTEDPGDATLFLSFARSNLLRLARGTDPVKRQWLRAYLAQAPSSPIKSELLRALAPSHQ